MPGLAKSFLSESHLKAIGLVAAEWSYTELALESLIWAIGGIEHRKGSAITTHLASEVRINILASLADTELKDKERKTRLQTIINEIRRLRTERNNIVHALWLSSSPPPDFLTQAMVSRKRKPIPAAMKINAKGKVKITKKPMTAKQINSIASQIGILVVEMYHFVHVLQQHEIAPTPKELAAALRARH